MRDLLSAIRASFFRPRDAALFLLAAATVFFLLVLIPVWTTPGNDIRFQLSLMRADLYVTMAAISVLNAFLLMLHLELRRRRASSPAPVRQAATGLAAASSAVLATIGCASCYSSILAVFGLGGTAFVVEHRWWFAAASILITLAALISTARRLERHCARCTV